MNPIDDADPETPVKHPTPAMDELFRISVAHFLEDKPTHLRVLADGILVAVPSIERWSRGLNLPRLVMRVRIHGLDMESQLQLQMPLTRGIFKFRNWSRANRRRWLTR